MGDTNGYSYQDFMGTLARKYAEEIEDHNTSVFLNGRQLYMYDTRADVHEGRIRRAAEIIQRAIDSARENSK